MAAGGARARARAHPDRAAGRPGSARRLTTRRCLVAMASLLAIALVAMHQLGGGHHPEPVLTSAAAPPVESMHADGHQGASAVRPVSGTEIDGAEPSRLDVAGSSPSPRPLETCLAVLLAAAALVRPWRWRWRGTPAREPGRARPVETSAASRAPPRALLAEICVLRT
jgi:hypothetical protein